MKKLNLKGIAVISALTLTISLTGCSDSNKQENVTESVSPSSQTYIEETPIEKEESFNTEKTPIEESSTTTDAPSNEEQTPEEFTFFKDAKQEITNYLESEEYEQLKEKGKYYVTTGIDFIFFDQPIKGVYFDDLTTELKEDVIRDVKSLDEAIMAYFPNYKESFQSKYRVASEFISEKYLDALDAIKEYLGEENYEALGDMKDQITEDLSESKDKALNYIKDKYQEWKNK